MSRDREAAHFGKALQASATSIPGLTIWNLAVHGDNRGWFKENWQREKMVLMGLPDFRPVQNNVSYNDNVGTTRGIHAEPWDKFVSVAAGRIFGVWVDLRAGPTYGCTFTAELDPSCAAFVPRGVGNGFQTLEPKTTYIYLVNDHYRPDATYTSVNLADKALSIAWPMPLAQAELSTKDRSHPPLSEVSPIPPRRTLVVGAGGQLGRACRQIYTDAEHVDYADREDLNVASSELMDARPWHEYDTIINAAAYTAVDNAETPEGRRLAWTINVSGVANLARVANAHNILLVHISSDYVFDGKAERPYREEDSICPLGVYGQTKAAADLVAATVPRHYIVRTSWVIGEGKNFVRTMLSLADRGVDPSVVNDQYGRLTFATELAGAIRHLITSGSPYGTYNVTGSGPRMSWADVARQVFTLAGHDATRVVDVSTDEYENGSTGLVSSRPKFSMLDLAKIGSTGFIPADSVDTLRSYIASTAVRS